MSDALRILCLGDVVGAPGVQAIQHYLRDWRRELAVDFVICNAENAADGSGLTPALAKRLRKGGCDVLTSGDHAWRKSDILTCINAPHILRPANFLEGSPGRGWAAYECGDQRLGVINLMGQVFTRPCDNPFRLAEQALIELADCRHIVVDIHAEATSEKISLAYYLHERVSAIFGTHTHVATADARILRERCGYITDVGMCGPHESIIGRRIEPVVEAMATAQHRPFMVATGDVRLDGVVFSLDRASGHCTAIAPCQLRVDERAADGDH